MLRIHDSTAPLAFAWAAVIVLSAASRWQGLGTGETDSQRSLLGARNQCFFVKATSQARSVFKGRSNAVGQYFLGRKLLPSVTSVGRNVEASSPSGSHAGEVAPERGQPTISRNDDVQSGEAKAARSAEAEDEEKNVVTQKPGVTENDIVDGKDPGTLMPPEEADNAVTQKTGMAEDDLIDEEDTEMVTPLKAAREEEGGIESGRAPGDNTETQQSPKNNDLAGRFSDPAVGRGQGNTAAATSEGDRGSATEESATFESAEGEEDEEDEEAGEEIDFQYYLPPQLRKVIPGTNIDYYDYVIQEERRARGETDEPPDVRGGLLPEEPEKDIPHVTFKNGVFAYCYTVETEDLLSRCADAAKLGEGVYVPMVNMTDFGRHDDRQLGNPDLQEVSLPSSHYKEAAKQFPDSWFEAVAQLKNRSRLAVGGLWFGPPDFSMMDSLIRKHPKVFDGILVDWDSGEGACMNKLTTPPAFNVKGQQSPWRYPKDFFMRYYVGGQDKHTCTLKDHRPYTLESCTSHKDRELDVPFGWNMTFPCFGGYEGRCFKAFSDQPQQACSEAQRYVFNPYNRASESMMIFLNDTCAGLGRDMPPHDLVLAI